MSRLRDSTKQTTLQIFRFNPGYRTDIGTEFYSSIIITGNTGNAFRPGIHIDFVVTIRDDTAVINSNQPNRALCQFYIFPGKG